MVRRHEDIVGAVDAFGVLLRAYLGSPGSRDEVKDALDAVFEVMEAVNDEVVDDAAPDVLGPERRLLDGGR